MLPFILLALLVAKLSGYKLYPVLKAYMLIPLLAVELAYISLQIAVINGYYNALIFTRPLQIAFLLSFIPAIIKWSLYRPAFLGSAFVIIGTFLNNWAINANGGKMPVFASLSRLTGYYNEAAMLANDSLHSVGGSETKLKILCDYIDIGFSIMSIGDLMIHSFSFIMVLSVVRHLNLKLSIEKGNAVL